MLRSYTAADFFTLGNASCGTISIFLCLNYVAEGRNRFFWIAFVLLFLALGCDIMVAFAQQAIDSALWFGAYKIGPATLHPLTLIYALSGMAMISATLRIPKP